MFLPLISLFQRIYYSYLFFRRRQERFILSSYKRLGILIAIFITLAGAGVVFALNNDK